MNTSTPVNTTVKANSTTQDAPPGGRRLSQTNLTELSEYELQIQQKPQIEWEIDYMPVKYEYNQKTEEQVPIFNNIFKLDVAASSAGVTLEIREGDLKYQILSSPI